jgi:glutamate--cysteine ligase
MTFRQFWKNGYDGERATAGDWNAHLTTLFPEARMKRYIEVRSVDSQPPELMLAVPAMVKGIFYDADCLDAAWDMVKRWKWEEIVAAYHQAHRRGLQASIRGIELRELARELIDIAEYGLNRQRVDPGDSEAVYLEQIRDMARRGRCPADAIIDKWQGVWDREPGRLVEGSAYRPAA